MSGGVDSSVAANLLKREGYEVIGITICFNLDDSTKNKPGCCSIQGIEDARRVAHKLNIRHYVLNMQEALNAYVIEDFCREYLRGRTPNPCVRCNQYIKFGSLLERALALDAGFLATGHYAKISAAEQYLLKKAKDKQKDQSYFLYRLTQRQLKHILFPLGNYTKGQVRNLARKFLLPVAEKRASQEICFIPGLDYRKFLKTRASLKIRPGLIVDKKGALLGWHKGISYYTIGQRQGLGIAKGYPLYISQINPRNNQLTVGRREDVLKSEFMVKDLHFTLKPVKKKVAFKVKIRYNHKAVPAQVAPEKGKLRVKFTQPQFAITPGQSAVFYDRDIILGGGIIDKVLD